MPRRKRKYPDLRRKFKVGDRVCHWKLKHGKRTKKYCGHVEKVIKDAVDVRWEPSGRVIRSWDFHVFEGGAYRSPLKKQK